MPYNCAREKSAPIGSVAWAISKKFRIAQQWDERNLLRIDKGICSESLREMYQIALEQFA